MAPYLRTDRRIESTPQARGNRLVYAASLTGQKRDAEAEPLLLEGYDGMKSREARMAATDRPYLDRAREWIVQLHQAWPKVQ